MAEQIISTALLEDREATRQKVELFVELGKPIIEGSNLTQESTSLTEDDVEQTKQLLQTIAPVNIDNYRLHAHLQLTSTFARRIGQQLKSQDPEKYKDLNLSELEILGLFHDVGRFFTHRWLRNELIERHFLKRLGVRQSLIDNIPNEIRYTSKDPDNKEQIDDTFEQIPLVQRIMEMADFNSKRTPDGGILTFDETMEYHNSSRTNYQHVIGQKPLWASERKLNPDVVDFSAKVYIKIRDNFQKLGIDLEKIREGILDEEKNSSVKAVIFDVGNVLIPNPDPETLADIEKVFDIDAFTAEPVWGELIPKMQIGELTEDDFWQQFKQKVGRPDATGYEPLFTRYLSYEITPEVKRIVDEIKTRGFVVAVHSDVIPPQANALENSGVYDGFQDKILSFGIKTTKKKEEAFIVAALKLGLPPQACLFIDDKEEYINLAQQAGMKGIVFKNAQQLEEDLQSKNII